jgi:hypothetical protein
MDTAEALKKAMQALRDAEIPQELWETALPLALADIRGRVPGEPKTPTDSSPNPRKATGQKRQATASGSARAVEVDDEPRVLDGLPDSGALFQVVAAETGVSEADLEDLFHVEGGRVQLKTPGRQLGANSKAATMTIAALLGGLALAATDHRKLPFKEINDYLKAKNVFHEKNASTYIKATPGFAFVANGRALYLTTRTGWAQAFADAAGRALGRSGES